MKAFVFVRTQYRMDRVSQPIVVLIQLQANICAMEIHVQSIIAIVSEDAWSNGGRNLCKVKSFAVVRTQYRMNIAPESILVLKQWQARMCAVETHK